MSYLCLNISVVSFFNLIMLIVYRFLLLSCCLYFRMFYHIYGILFIFFSYICIICRIFVSIFIDYWAQGLFLLALNFSPNGPS